MTRRYASKIAHPASCSVRRQQSGGFALRVQGFALFYNSNDSIQVSNDPRSCLWSGFGQNRGQGFLRLIGDSGCVSMASHGARGFDHGVPQAVERLVRHAGDPRGHVRIRCGYEDWRTDGEQRGLHREVAHLLRGVRRQDCEGIRNCGRELLMRVDGGIGVDPGIAHFRVQFPCGSTDERVLGCSDRGLPLGKRERLQSVIECHRRRVSVQS